MPSLAEVRQKYPQYDDLTDSQLADALYKRFYSDMDRAAFDKAMGREVTAEAVAGKVPLTEFTSDTLPSLPSREKELRPFAEPEMRDFQPEALPPVPDEVLRPSFRDSMRGALSTPDYSLTDAAAEAGQKIGDAVSDVALSRRVAHAVAPHSAGQVAARGLNKGVLANTFGFPVDMANAILQHERERLLETAGSSFIPEIKEPVGGSASIMKLLDYFGAGGQEAETPGEKILQRGTEEVGTMLMPAAKTARSLKELTGMLALALSGGTTAGIAKQEAPKDDIWQAAADIIGNLIGTIGPVGTIQAVERFLTKVPLTRGAQETAAAQGLRLKPEQAAELAAAEEAAPQIPGVQYAPAELLNDPSLLAAKKRLDVSSPEAAQAEVARQTANRQALGAAKETEAPLGDVDAPRTAVARQKGAVEGRLTEAEGAAQERGATAIEKAEADARELAESVRRTAEERAARIAETGAESVEGARSAAADRVATVQASGTAEREQLEGEVERALGDYGAEPGARKAAASKVARSEIEAAQDEAEKRASQLFRAADPDGTLTVETGRLSQVVDDITEEAISRGREDAIPDLISSGKITGYLGEQPLQRLNGLRSMLGEQIRAEQRAGNRQKASFLIQLQRGVDEALEAEIDDQISAKMAAGATDTARTLERERDLWLTERQAARASGLDLRTGTEWESGRLAGGGTGMGERGAPYGRLDVDPSSAATAETGGRGRAGARPSPKADRESAATALRAARTFFRDNVAQTFRQGRVGKVLKVGSDNRPVVAPEATLGQFTDEASLNDFVKAVGGRPAAVRAMQDHALSDMVQYATDTAGKIVPRKVAAWRKKYEPVLRAFPEVDRFTANVQQLQERVTAAEKAASGAARAAEREGREAVTAAERSARESARQAEREGRAEIQSAERSGRQNVRSVTAQAKDALNRTAGRKKRSLGAIEKSAAQFWLDRSPDKAVSGILSSGNPALAAKEAVVMVRKGGGEEAVNGVSRAAWDVVTSRIFSNVEDGGIKAAQGAKFLSDNEAALRVLMGSEKYKRAQELVKSAQITSRAGRAVVGPGSDTVQKAGRMDKALDLAKQGTSILGGAAAGASFGGPIGAAIGGALAKGGEMYVVRQRHAVQELMREALNDPATFRLLTTRITRDNEDAIARALKAKLAAFGIRQAAAAESSDAD